ncbi:MAG: PDDEXK nuclease domain-containing protein [bacterium]
MTDMIRYKNLLNSIKNRIRAAQVRATFAANAEMILMYFDIGKMIHERQQKEGWSSSVIPRLSKDIKNELSDIKGFSERNLGRMVAFYREYSCVTEILPQPVAKLDNSEKLPRTVAKLLKASDLSSEKMPPTVAQLEKTNLLKNIPWGHHFLLIEKIKDIDIRFWYMGETIKNGWNRDVLASMIKNNLHNRQGNSSTNFNHTLPEMQSDLAAKTLKDPYIFDFLTIAEPFAERELETELIKHLENFLTELGTGFAFVGRQYKLTVSDKDFYIDLLFYHLKLRSFVIVELKKGDFKPEYAGKMNFYCSAVDDLLKHSTDQPTIGLILCESKNKIFAEYALRDIQKPIGVSDYELTKALPENLKSSLPTIEELEKALEIEDESDKKEEK